jgi:hypothetical protein
MVLGAKTDLYVAADCTDVDPQHEEYWVGWIAI